MKFGAIVITGRLCSGKTTLSAAIAQKFSAKLVTIKDLLELATGNPLAPSKLETSKAALESQTNGRWVKEALARHIVSIPEPYGVLVLDGLETAAQVAGLRELGFRVLHIHLHAQDDVLWERFRVAQGDTGARKAFDARRRRWGPTQEDMLVKAADAVIDTERCSTDDVFARVRARLEINPVTAHACVDVLIGGQFGSEGKGNVAHYLAPEYDVLVRVGGPNAGHKVYRSNDKPYTFKQLPSGFLGNSEAKLVIGAGAVIGLDTLRREIGELQITPERLIIDPQAMIIDPRDVDWEQKVLGPAIGSTAQGIGSATARKILGRIPKSDVQLAKDEPLLKSFVGDTIEFFAGCISEGKKIMLEGTQGTLLSLHHGFYPHVTSRATTAAACLAEAGLTQRHVRRVVMVCRTYPIRVGDSTTGNTSGYMGKTIDFEEIARRSGVPLAEIKTTEVGSVSGRTRRIAEFDWHLLRRSLLLNGPTDLALTFADYLGVQNQTAFRYEQLTDETQRFIGELEQVSGLPVSLISTAFNERNIVDRRMW
jgi:adenylosuccinate synthase